jgi:hypothetical protein
MRYDIHVAAHSGGQETRFEYERDERLEVGDSIRQFSMVYRVTRVQPLGPSESDDFDAVIEAEWLAGPAQAEFVSG